MVIGHDDCIPGSPLHAEDFSKFFHVVIHRFIRICRIHVRQMPYDGPSHSTLGWNRSLGFMNICYNLLKCHPLTWGLLQFLSILIGFAGGLADDDRGGVDQKQSTSQYQTCRVVFLGCHCGTVLMVIAEFQLKRLAYEERLLKLDPE